MSAERRVHDVLSAEVPAVSFYGGWYGGFGAVVARARRRLRRRRRRASGSAGAGGTAAASETSAGEATPPTGGGEIESLTLALPGTIRSLDFVHSFDSYTMAALSNGLEGLLVFDNEGALQPRLAESWSQPDANTIVYQIRQGVTFWDGSPLTADDVAFSMGQHIDPEDGSQLATFFGSVESIEATSASEVLVKLKQPDPAFTLIPAAQAGLIVQKTFSEEHKNDSERPRCSRWVRGPTRSPVMPDQGVTLERNESYWGERPAVKQVSLKFIVEDATRLLAMQSGEIDGAFQVPIDQVPQVGGDRRRHHSDCAGALCLFPEPRR